MFRYVFVIPALVFAIQLYDAPVVNKPMVIIKKPKIVMADPKIKEIKCLADNIFHEASGESFEGKQAVGCVMYYGMPEKDVAKLKTLNCDVLGLFAAKEQWISPAVVAQFEKDMATAGKSIKVKSYDADHAFANPSNPIYNKVASEDAYGLAINY